MSGTTGRRVAVVGAGWAGLAAAVRLVERGAAVTVFETAAVPGGRARTLADGADGRTGDGAALDNGQHILIGAYVRTLALMRTVGVEPARVLHRMPLTLRYPDGRGLAVPRGPATIALARAVWGCRGWTWRDRLALLKALAAWSRDGFACDPSWTVQRLCRDLTDPVRELLIDPLCVAALNTPSHAASGAVLLRVLRDALFSGPGSADLLLPKAPLGALLPEPAIAWLRDRGAVVQAGQRVEAVAGAADARAATWTLRDAAFDAVVLACPAAEAARLARPHAPSWSARAAAFDYEPIVTVYLQAPEARLPQPMTALVESSAFPAQFAFDLGAIGGPPGRFAFVVSGARRWVDRGLEATGAAVLRQAMAAFEPGTWPVPPRVLRVLAEKRATFRCVPALDRPPMAVAPGLWAAGDYVDGPYPATLEGAVRAGEAAAAAVALSAAG